jgi:hypothetical protein
MQSTWSKPVTVMSERIGTLDHIRDTGAAARYLLNRWPQDKRDRPKYVAAKQASLDALEGELAPTLARKAFVDAAKDARIYVVPNPQIQRLQGPS